MLVTMKTKIGGYRNLEEWPPVGGTIDLPDHEALDLISQGYASVTETAPTPEVTTDADATSDDGEPAAGDPPADATSDDGEPAAGDPPAKPSRARR
jgi:hypothetical protein